MSDGLVTLIASLFIAIGGGGAGVKYVLERRAAKASGYIANATKELVVDAKKLATVEHQLELMQRAWDAERESKDRVIADLRADNHALHKEVENTRSEARDLRERIAKLQGELDHMRDRVEAMLPPDDAGPHRPS